MSLKSYQTFVSMIIRLKYSLSLLLSKSRTLLINYSSSLQHRHQRRLVAKSSRNGFLLFAIFLLVQLGQRYIDDILHPLSIPIAPRKLEKSSSVQFSRRCAVIRIFGNNVYPLQQRDQGSRNLETILSNEDQSALCVNIWVVNRIINSTERSQILNLLQKEPHVITIDLDGTYLLDYKYRPKDVLSYLTDINHARNAGLQYALELGIEWSILLDGNSFITRESYHIMLNYLEEQQKISGKLAAFIPMSRILDNGEESRVHFKWNTTLVSLRGSVSRLQESHLAFHHEFLTQTVKKNISLFDEIRSYGKQSKLFLLRHLFHQNGDVMACPQAFGNSELNTKRSTVSQFFKAGLECGYCLRMPYWPDGRDERRVGSRERTVEMNGSNRIHQRRLGYSYLIRSIEQYLKNESINTP
ncbi:uncharacterized protein LOC142340035 isoform X2 [Convolutriloba macropyga]|uniref:uncharacterized protein LOC142340035 isoform X2 n=1 Tax=Convolutriloba macropyga TaxID=536237 RepID=UPI003F522571